MSTPEDELRGYLQQSTAPAAQPDDADAELRGYITPAPPQPQAESVWGPMVQGGRDIIGGLANPLGLPGTAERVAQARAYTAKHKGEIVNPLTRSLTVGLPVGAAIGLGLSQFTPAGLPIDAALLGGALTAGGTAALQAGAEGSPEVPAAIKDTAEYLGTLGAGKFALGPIMDKVGGAAKNLLYGPEVDAAVQTVMDKADKLGLKIPGYDVVKGGLLQLAGQAGAHVPFSGAPQASESLLQQFTRRAAQTFGKQDLQPSTIKAAQQEIGNELDATLGKGQVVADQQFNDDLNSVYDSLGMGTHGLSKEQVSGISRMRDRIKEIADSNNNVISGPQYQELTNSKSDLQRAISRNDAASPYYADIDRALDAAFKRNSPANVVDAYTKAKYKYRNLKTLEPMIAGLGPERMLDPAAMRQAVINNWGPTAVARGEAGELGDLADVADYITPVHHGLTSKLVTTGANLLASGAGGALGATVGHPGVGASVAGLGLLPMNRFINTFLRSKPVRDAMLRRTAQANPMFPGALQGQAVPAYNALLPNEENQ